MATAHAPRAATNSDKVLWTGVAIVILLVLVMGAALLRLQAQPPEPRPVVLPTTEVPPLVASAAAPEAVASVTPMPAASAAMNKAVDTGRPRRVQAQASEPAVARTP